MSPINIEGNIVVSGIVKKRGRLSRLWFKRQMLMTSRGYIYSSPLKRCDAISVKKKHELRIFSKIHSSEANHTLTVETMNEGKIELKFLSKEDYFTWKTALLQVMDEQLTCKRRRSSSSNMIVEDMKNKEPSGNGKMRNNGISSQEKPNSGVADAAKAAREELRNTEEESERGMEKKSDRVPSATNAIDGEERFSERIPMSEKERGKERKELREPKGLKDHAPKEEGDTWKEYSTRLLLHASPPAYSINPIKSSSEEAFDMLEASKKRKRAFSSSSLLSISYTKTQYFNPEFDPIIEESEPASIRTILHNRFLEVLDATILDTNSGVVLVLDKPGLRMINQLVFSKSELKQCGISVIQSLHSLKRHTYPELAVIYVVDPLYRENGIASIDLCILDLISTPKHFAYGSILLLTMMPEMMEQQKIWQNSLLLKSMRLPPAIIAGNNEVIQDNLILLNLLQRESVFYTSHHPDYEATVDRTSLLLCSLFASLNEFPYFRYDRDQPISRVIAEKTLQYLENRMRKDPDFWYRGCSDSHNRSSVIILFRNSDHITPLKHSVAYEALLHDYMNMDSEGRITSTNHEVVTLMGSLKEKLNIHKHNELWDQIRDKSLQHAKDALADFMTKYEKSLELNNQKSSPLRSIRRMSKCLDSMVEFKELCDSHTEVITVLQRICEIFHLKQVCSLEQTIASTFLPSGAAIPYEELLNMVKRMVIGDFIDNQTKARLLLVFLFSYPHTVHSEDWSFMVEKAEITDTVYSNAIKAAEYLCRTQPSRYDSLYRANIADHVDSKHSLEDIVFLRNVPYTASILKTIKRGFLSHEEYPFLIKPPSDYDVADQPEDLAKQQNESLLKKRKRRLFFVVIGGLSYSELHHLRTIGEEMQQQLVIVSTSLINPESHLSVLADVTIPEAETLN